MVKRPLEDALELEQTGPGHYRAQNMSSDEIGPTGRPAFIVGGQMLGQAIVAAHAADRTRERSRRPSLR